MPGLVQISPPRQAGHSGYQNAEVAPAEIESSSALTRDLHVLPIEDNRYVIYAPLRRAAFIANARVVKVLKALSASASVADLDPDGSISALLEHFQMLNAGPEPVPTDTFQGAPQPLTATLLLTTACNLRCTYCYASAGDTPLEFMPIEVARSGIDFVVSNAKKTNAPMFAVSYHGGGEPTANWKVLRESTLYAREQAAASGLRVDITLTSNGVFSAEKAEWLADHANSASISFDGLPGMHDAHRKQVDGSGSSEAVESTLRIFDRLRFPYGIRITVTADQVFRLAESVEHIYTHFHPTSILIEPVYQMGRGHSHANAESVDFIEAFRDARRRAARFGRTVEFSGARIGTITKHFCGITRDNFCLSAKGNVTACYESFTETSPWAGKFFYGRPTGVPGEYFIDVNVLTGLRSQTVDNRSFCHSCFARWTCGGDCYHKSLEANGDSEFAGTGRCHVIRELTKDMLLAKIAASGGWFWHEPVGSPHV